MADLGTKVKEAAIIAGFGLVSCISVYSYFIPDTVNVTITDTTVKRDGDEDRYLVFTNGGPFENTEAWYRFKFSSTQMQNNLVALKGQQVELTKYGWRVQPLSWYENIVDVKKIP